jgi:hypothetical protein
MYPFQLESPVLKRTYQSASKSGKHLPNQKHFKDLEFKAENLSCTKSRSKRKVCEANFVTSNINLLMDFKIVSNKQTLLLYLFLNDNNVK